MKLGKFISYLIYICIISTLTLLAFAHISPSFKDATLRLISATKSRLVVHGEKFTSFFSETISNSEQRDAGSRQDKLTAKVTPKDPKLKADNQTLSPSKVSKIDVHDIDLNKTTFTHNGEWKETAFIYIVSTPESAMVMIDSSFVGKAPLTVKVNQGGTYRINVKYKYYDTWEKIIRVEPYEVTRVEAELTPGKGLLTIISRPQEAEIYIDEKPRGRTPQTIKSLQAGIHQIHLVKNKLEYLGEVEILAGKDAILDVGLKKLKSTLPVDSTPRGADVYIDGIHRGTTPVTIEDIRIGRHEMILVKGDSLAYVDTIHLDVEEENRHSFTLKSKAHFKKFFSSTIQVESEVNKAFVYLNQIFRGTTPIKLEQLRSGEHEILVVKSTSDGSHFFKSKIFLASKEIKKIHVKKNEYRFEKH